ncbi:MAG: fibrobacter succinogenes major paralogous domain-containing protein [Fibrobacter sp.]|nr:fibrobacter succinogenes major paralogous domain-containing protein [Fibrobacter sp.]
MRFLVIGFVAAVLVACGDDDSCFATRPSGDSSSACEDCDGSSSSKAKSSSSSSVTPKSSDSETSVSSSSVKSSSSVTSSSSAKDVILSSSEGSSDSKSSSSEKAESSSSKAIEPAEGTLTDTRDGKTYKTVTIGTQTWMAENLNYAYTGVPYKYTYIDSSYTSDSTSWCYGNDPANCSRYGRLYTWAAAMDSVGTWSANGKDCGYYKGCSPTFPVRGICPEGWHLPDTTEWGTLFTAVGGLNTAGVMLKSASGWNDYEGENGDGSDAYAFSVLPAGYREGGSGKFYNDGEKAFFWSSAVRGSNANSADFLNFCNYMDTRSKYFHAMTYGHSVRCVKDE